MKHLAATCLLAAAVLFGTVSVALAHEVTTKGTVASVDTSKPDEKAVTVTVVDATAKQSKKMVFYADPETKIHRGDTQVSFADVTFVAGEPITVVVNHDLDEQLAIEIRLEPRK